MKLNDTLMEHLWQEGIFNPRFHWTKLRIKCVMAFGKKLRACEILSIWRQHHRVEQFFRRLKTDLQIHKMRMRSREGVYATIGIKLLAYLLMENLSATSGLTFHQIKIRAKREVDVCSFFKEHFHSCMVA